MLHLLKHLKFFLALLIPCKILEHLCPVVHVELGRLADVVLGDDQLLVQTSCTALTSRRYTVGNVSKIDR